MFISYTTKEYNLYYTIISSNQSPWEHMCGTLFVQEWFVYEFFLAMNDHVPFFWMNGKWWRRKDVIVIVVVRRQWIQFWPFLLLLCSELLSLRSVCPSVSLLLFSSLCYMPVLMLHLLFDSLCLYLYLYLYLHLSLFYHLCYITVSYCCPLDRLLYIIGLTNSILSLV